MGLKEIGCEGMDRINLSQDKNKWQALVNMVLNLWVPYDWGMGDFSTEELLSSQEGLFSIGLDIIGLHDRDEFLRT